MSSTKLEIRVIRLDGRESFCERTHASQNQISSKGIESLLLALYFKYSQKPLEHVVDGYLRKPSQKLNPLLQHKKMMIDEENCEIHQYVTDGTTTVLAVEKVTQELIDLVKNRSQG